MRKILSLVLVLSMVLGSFGFAFAAPTDVEGTDYEDAVTRLEALEILSGYDDGTFKPGKTITRAEFAKIMVHAVGVGESAQYSKGATDFSDVPATHWASGYINQAAGMEIINGRGDGTFGPEEQVTYAQAVTMIVRALGYEPKAQAMGGYPNGYLAVAAEEDITDDISFADAAAATRGDVAKMVDASLDVNLMYQATWGDTPEYKNDDDDKTLLKTKLHIDEIEGVVAAVPNTKSSLEDNEIEVDSEDGTDIYELLVGDVNYNALLGLEVTIWADDDEVVNIEIDTDEDNIKFDTIVKKDSNDEVVYLYVDDEEYDWAKNAEVYVNFEEEKTDKIPAEAYGYFVLNDDDEVTYANLFDFEEVEAGVVYDVDDDKYKFVDRSGDEEELDLSDYDDGVFVYNEKFGTIDIDDVDVNSAIYAWEDSDELHMIVKNSTVTGELEKVKDGEVKIDGEEYDKADQGAAYSDDEFDSFKAYNDKDSLEDINGEKVTAVLDLNDEVQLIYSDTKATSATKYGIVTYAELGSKPEVSVVIENADGEEDEIDYKFDDRDDSREPELKEAVNADTWYDSVDDGLKFVLMKFKLNKDGDIDSEDLDYELVDEFDNDAARLEKEADEDLVYKVDGNDRDKYYISEDTVFMTALDDDGKLDPKVLSYDSVYESEFEAKANEKVVVIGEEGKDADMIVFISEDFEGVDDDVYFGVVTEDVGSTADDDEVNIDVFNKKEEVYALDDEDDFKNGSIVAFNMNTDDEATIDHDYDDSYLEDRYVKFGEDSDGDKDMDYVIVNGDSYRLDDSVVVRLLDDDKEDDGKGKVSDIEDYKYFKAIVNDEEKDGKIVAITLREELEDDDEGSSAGDKGEVDYITSERIIIDGDTKDIDEDTKLWDADEDEILAMGEEIKDELEKGMRVEVISYDDDDDDLISELKLLGEAIDKSDLEDAIDDAKDLEKDDYESGWDDFQDALKDAEEVMDDPDADQDEVDAATKALKDAKKDLVPVDGEDITAELDVKLNPIVQKYSVAVKLSDSSKTVEKFIIDGDDYEVHSVKGDLTISKGIFDEEPSEVKVVVDGETITAE